MAVQCLRHSSQSCTTSPVEADFAGDISVLHHRKAYGAGHCDLMSLRFVLLLFEFWGIKLFRILVVYSPDNLFKGNLALLSANIGKEWRNFPTRLWLAANRACSQLSKALNELFLPYTQSGIPLRTIFCRHLAPILFGASRITVEQLYENILLSHWRRDRFNLGKKAGDLLRVRRPVSAVQ